MWMTAEYAGEHWERGVNLPPQWAMSLGPDRNPRMLFPSRPPHWFHRLMLRWVFGLRTELL